MKKQNYSEQIKSPKWQKKRLEVLNLRGFKCEECGNEEQQLHIHHRVYIKNRQAWEYDNDIFQVLCSDCHEKVHQKKEKVVEVKENIPEIHRRILALIDNWQSVDPRIAENIEFMLSIFRDINGDKEDFIFSEIYNICESNYYNQFISFIHDYNGRVEFELEVAMKLASLQYELKLIQKG